MLNLIAARRVVCAAVLLALAVFASPAKAAFHLWAITEVYSNSSGSLQFIELSDQFGSQNFVNGNTVNSLNVGGSITHTFTVPGSSLPGSTLGHSLLFGTSGIQAAGGPAPDYILPNGFLFTAGGTINFFGLNSGVYPALPTDGTSSLNWATGHMQANSPTNFAGQTGSVPAPSTLSIGAALGWLSMRRRRSTPRT